ncbi:MAG TPA: hypothetical protein VGE37_00045 [Archangium sp.]
MTALPLVLQLLAAEPSPELPRLLVQEFTVRGVDADTAASISDGIGPEIDKRGYFRTLTSKDVQTILGVERQRALLGCSPEGSSCLTELAGAMGAPFVLSGTISKIGPSLQLTMQLLDVSKSQVVARTIRIARDPESLRQLLPWAVAEATATPPPPRPSKVPGFIFIGAGGAAAATGIAVGASALIQEQQLQHDLDSGQRTSGLLESPAYYKQKGDELALQKTLGLAALCGGAALIGVGIYLLPSGAASGDASASLLFTGNGAALAGSF